MLPPCCSVEDRELFFQNMAYVRTVTLAIAQFCPQAIVAIQTPPVDCNFALCMHVSNSNHFKWFSFKCSRNYISDGKFSSIYCKSTA